MISFSLTVEPLILLYMAAINCEYTLVQYSVSTSHCLSLINLTDPTICESPKSPDVQALIKNDVTISMRYYNFFLSICCSVATLFTGSWSDHYGRRLPIIFALISSIAAQIICFTFWSTLKVNSIWLIYLAGLVSGISGSSSSLIANCFGYTADVTSIKERSRAMSTMEAMLYLGGAIGFSTGSFMLKFLSQSLENGFAILFLVHSILLIYVLFYLKESKSNVEPVTFKGLFRLSHVTTVLWTIGHRRAAPYKRFWLLTIITCAFIATFGSNSMTSILYVFLRNKPLNWTSESYGYLQSINYLLGGFTLLIFVPVVQKLLPRLINDDLFALLGFTSRAVGLISIGLASSSLHAFLTPIAFIFSELTLPSIRSIVSKIVDPDEKGKAFAFLGLLSNFTFLLGSQISSLIYYNTSSFCPGLVLIILGCFELIPVTIFLIKFNCYNKAFASIDGTDLNEQETKINNQPESSTGQTYNAIES